MEGHSSAWHVPAANEAAANFEKSYQWMAKIGLKDITEVLIAAAQEQGLSMRSKENLKKILRKNSHEKNEDAPAE